MAENNAGNDGRIGRYMSPAVLTHAAPRWIRL
jgi:hypothetical protein